MRIFPRMRPIAKTLGIEEIDARFRLAPAELLGIVAFWMVLAAITAAGRRLDLRIPGVDPSIARAFVSLSFIEYAIWALLTVPIIWLSSRLSVESGERIAPRVAVLIALGVVVASLVDATLAAVSDAMLLPRGGTVTGAWPWGLSGFEFLDDLMVYFAILGAGIARDYYLRYIARVEESIQLQTHAARLEGQLAQAELNVLRSQLNPHFLFNTLHAVSALVERDPRGVRRMIARLSELLRSTLDGTHEQKTSLGKELETLTRYVEIMEIRYQGRLTVTTSADGDIRDALVPSLILQPIVENAMKHGVDGTTGEARIDIRVTREGSNLVLAVRDNGPGPSAGTPSAGSGVGLGNTRARLQQLYGTNQNFTLIAAPEGGAVAELTLPYESAAAPQGSDAAGSPMRRRE